MSVGPVHLIVIGFQGHDDDFKGKVPRALRAAHALRAARRRGDVRVLDMLLIRKDVCGAIEEVHVSQLGEQERGFAGSVVGGLLGLRTERVAPAKPPATYGVRACAEHEFGLQEADLWVLTRDIPNGWAAAIVLVEHLWAIRLQEAIDEAGCRMVAEGMLTSATLSGVGAEVAMAEHAADNTNGRQQIKPLARRHELNALGRLDNHDLPDSLVPSLAVHSTPIDSAEARG